MTVKDIALVLVGNSCAMERVARSRAALPARLLLVLMTSVPRKYDQTHVSEEPLLWFLKPLVFSLASGTWVFLLA